MHYIGFVGGGVVGTKTSFFGKGGPQKAKLVNMEKRKQGCVQTCTVEAQLADICVLRIGLTLDILTMI